MVPGWKSISKKEVFQYSIATLSLSLVDPGGSLRQQKIKAILCSQMTKDIPLSKLDRLLRNAKWVYDGVKQFRMVPPQHIYCDSLEYVAKTVANDAHQNEEINIKVVSN